MDEKLINAYISNLAAEVQSLKMENILLKTRLNLLEQEKAEATALQFEKLMADKIAKKSQERLEEEKRKERRVWMQRNVAAKLLP